MNAKIWIAKSCFTAFLVSSWLAARADVSRLAANDKLEVTAAAAGLDYFAAKPKVSLSFTKNGRRRQSSLKVSKTSYPAEKISCLLSNKSPVYGKLQVTPKGGAPITVREVVRNDSPVFASIFLRRAANGGVEGVVTGQNLGGKRARIALLEDRGRPMRCKVSAAMETDGMESIRFSSKKTPFNDTVRLRLKNGATLGVTTVEITDSEPPVRAAGSAAADASLVLTVASDWGSGCVVNAVATNNTGADMEGWTLAFSHPHRPASVWNAELVSSDGDHHVFRNLSWNSKISAGGKVEFGFVAEPGNVVTSPINATWDVAAAPPEPPNPPVPPEPDGLAPPAPSISILKDWQAGGYDIKWTKWSGEPATSWRLYENGSIIHEAPVAAGDVQSAEYHVADGKPYGVYSYQVELVNADGASLSDLEYYAVDGASAIVLESIDHGGRQALQVDLDYLESALFKIENLANPNPEFIISTNNPGVVSGWMENGKLRLKALKTGRAGVRIEDVGSGETRFIGVRVRTWRGGIPGMPEHLAIGSVSEDSTNDLDFWRGFGKDLTNRRVDIRYIYINGGPKNQGVGWRTWTDRDGFRVTSYIRESLKLGMIPFLVYYNIPDGGESYTTDKEHVQSHDYMLGYFEDLKFALELAKAETDSEIIGFLMEPDFIGYLAQNNEDPASMTARTDAAYDSGALTRGVDPDFPNTVRGLVEAINHTIKKHLPNSYLGWQFNLWASPAAGFTVPTGAKGVIHLTDSMGLEAGRRAVHNEAAAIADYYVKAGVLTHGADFVSIDKYGLDGGAEDKNDNPAESTWFWNAVHWTNYLEFVKAMHERSALPVVLWQLPVGRINSSLAANPYSSSGEFPDLDNTATRFEDSAPTYFFGDSFAANGARQEFFRQTGGAAKVSDNGSVITWESHLDLARDAGVNAALFGAGVGHSTDAVGSPPTEDYWWISKTQQYYRDPVMMDGSGGDDDPPANRAPTAADDSVTVTSGEAAEIAVLANDHDPDGDTISLTSVSMPNHGTAEIAGGKIIYTAPADFAGADSFDYTIADPDGETDSATVTVTVEADGGDDDDESGALVITITDDWGGGFTAEAVFSYSGTESVDGWTLQFDFPHQITGIWDAELVESDGITHKLANTAWNNLVAPGGTIKFGFNGSPGNVSAKAINVLFNSEPATPPANRAPNAVDDSAETDMDTAVLINVLANDSDPDGDSLILDSATSPANGSAVIQSGKILYTPAAGFAGADSFDYTIADPDGETDSAMVSVTVKESGTPEAPRLSIAAASVDEPGYGEATIEFIVSLSKAALNAVSVDYHTEDGTAVAGEDYQAAAGTLTFAPGETVKTIAVTVLGDLDEEEDETLIVSLSNPENAEIAVSSATGVIRDNDGAEPSGGGIKAAYFAEWGIYDRNYHIADVPAEHLTHLIYAFAKISDTGEIDLFDRYAAIEKSYPGDSWDQALRGNFNQMLKLKAEHPHLKTIIAVGGWTLSKYFSDIAATAAAREKFAKSAVAFILQYGFDGIDFDWEYPVSGGNWDVIHRPEDGRNYTLLVAETRRQLDAQSAIDGKEYLITVASPAGYDKTDNMELAAMAGHIDWFNVMSYDYNGAWDNNTAHNAPLYPHFTELNSVKCVSSGIPAAGNLPQDRLKPELQTKPVRPQLAPA